MDHRRVTEILESYLFEDVEDEDVKEEIRERIAGLSDDPDIEINISNEIDSEHDGLLVEVVEHGNITEFVVSIETMETKDTEDE